MNCQKFETVVSELARGQMMAAEQRGEALAHSDVCEDCAARLRNEEMLLAGCVARRGDGAVECAGQCRRQAARSLSNPHQVCSRVAKRQSSVRYWLVAVAAVLLIAMSVVAFRWTMKRKSMDRSRPITHEEPRPRNP